jgi:hypothetical protein
MPPSYARVPPRALQDPTLTGTDIRVLCAIGLHVDKNGEGCWASSKTLALEAGVSRNKFFSAAKKLMAAGIITRESRNSKNGGATSSAYAIVFDEESRGASTENGTSPQKAGDLRLDAGTAIVPKPVRSTMNSPSNNPLNDENGGVIDLDTEGRTLFSQLRRKRVELRTPTGTQYRIPPDVITALSPRVRGVIDIIGGPSAIAEADDVAVRVLRSEFAKVYAATSRERTA